MKTVYLCILVVHIGLSRVLGYEKKCCPGDTLYNEEGKLCREPSTNSTTPPLLDCNEFFSIANGTYNLTFSVKADGFVKFKKGNFETDLIFEEYCIALSDASRRVTLVMCNIPKVVTGADQDVAEVLLFISGCFFAFTAIVYALIPELRDLQGKIIISLCGTSSMGWFLMATLHMEYSNMNVCAATGFITYFFMMASFFWMNALSIQVYRSVRYPSSAASEDKPFMYYSIYVWGCSGSLLISAILANYMPGTHYIPGFGYDTCWFNGTVEIWAYFYGPLALILLGNCAIFARTSMLIWRNTRTSNHARALAYKVWMSARIFVLVGVMWVFELASSAHGQYHVLWLIADIYNLLQGVSVFLLLVVMRRRALKALAKRGLLCDFILLSSLLTSGDEEDEQIIAEAEDATVVVPLDK